MLLLRQSTNILRTTRVLKQGSCFLISIYASPDRVKKKPAFAGFANGSAMFLLSFVGSRDLI